MSEFSSSAFADSKPHYHILNGLRGVAAVMVIWYHIFEAFATSPIDQKFNHGYLAVDFFFVLSGFVIGLATFAIGNFSGYGNLGVGWTLADNNFIGGMLRLLYAFSAGLLMSRIFKLKPIKRAFSICSIIIIVLLSMPYVGFGDKLWINGLYDAICTIIVFPILVYIGACGVLNSKVSSNICKLLGDISYPLYMIHYPFIYLFYSWIWKNELTFTQTWPIALLLLFGNILLAFILLKIYDIPVRNILTKIFIYKKAVR